ncbi:complex I NDUFA9 subunit family protein [Magnetofaba australis]|uniref:Putative NAD-dependent epimerase/dehydratase n=1 Tax=Magnetofaba australis IT-1 TaxID=1434232 RepID=A0A1Y2K5S9_9PROT|nr:complex I NDUFA9 subunit family protein [Magnetofaba australis]OSM05031.1 putative NAD-dependent epimerase/dehydratase [Magnetofaba australis IT-1]
MILVTGANGFVGGALGRHLHASGHALRGFARHPEQRKEPDAPYTEWSAGSILDPHTLDAAMAGVDTVIHLVGILAETRTLSFEQVHHQGTRNVLEAAKRAGVTRYIQMSSLGTRRNAASRYHQSKWLAEEAVRASGLDYTILRPSVIFGPHDSFINLFAKMARYSPALPLIGDGKSLMQPIWVEDLARIVVQCLEKPETIAQTYELGGPEQIPFREILDAILQTLKLRRFKLPGPVSLLKLEAALFEAVLPTPPLTRDQLIMAQEDNICSGAPIPAPFACEPMPLREGISAFLKP